MLALGDALDERRARVRRVRLRIFQVGAGRERAAALVTGEDDAANGVVVLHRLEVAPEPLVEVRAPRVAGRRTTERDDADVIALLVRDGHVRCPLSPPHGT